MPMIVLEVRKVVNGKCAVEALADSRRLFLDGEYGKGSVVDARRLQFRCRAVVRNYGGAAFTVNRLQIQIQPNPNMIQATERAMEHIGESKAVADHDHDMVHELSRRLDAYWRYDQYIANAEGDKKLQQFWTDVQNQEKQNIGRLKSIMIEHCRKDCF